MAESPQPFPPRVGRQGPMVAQSRSAGVDMTDHVVVRPGGTLDSEVLDLVSRIFDMARSGHTATLAAYLDAGVPANLTNTNRDTLRSPPAIMDTPPPSRR